jgi:hypothetical protein
LEQRNTAQSAPSSAYDVLRQAGWLNPPSPDARHGPRKRRAK